MSDNNYQKWLHGELSDSDLSHRQAGAFQERERIIKLLEDWYPIYYPKSITTGGGEGELIGELVAKIRGEQK